MTGDERVRLLRLETALDGSYPDFVNCIAAAAERAGISGEIAKLMEDYPHIAPSDVGMYFFSRTTLGRSREDLSDLLAEISSEDGANSQL